MADNAASTASPAYAIRLSRSVRGVKAILPNPYRRRLNALSLGRVLDVGCGVGRCLTFVGGNGVGVDHNEVAVEICRQRGLEAYLPEEFEKLSLEPFDSLLLSHVVEHMEKDEANELLRRYLPFVRQHGKVVLITPQPAGQRSDPTHVRYVGPDVLRETLEAQGIRIVEERSFPFPRIVGGIFRHNENQIVGVIGEAPLSHGAAVDSN